VHLLTELRNNDGQTFADSIHARLDK